MSRTETISSPANSLVKNVRRAVSRSGLTPDGLCVAEGFHLLEEALRSEVSIPAILIAESAFLAAEPLLPDHADTRLAVLPDDLFATLATTETTQGLITLVRLPEWIPELLFADPALVVILDGIQDPGNAGAIVRAAEAFGATGVIFGKGTVSPHNPRTLRGSAGSLFRIPFVAGLEAAAIVAQLQQNGCAAFAAMPWSEGVPTAEQTNFRGSTALVIGSEGRGIGEGFAGTAQPVAIPTQQVESLNASVAAAVLLYEASRQRRHGAARG